MQKSPKISNFKTNTKTQFNILLFCCIQLKVYRFFVAMQFKSSLGIRTQSNQYQINATKFPFFFVSFGICFGFPHFLEQCSRFCIYNCSLSSIAILNCKQIENNNPLKASINFNKYSKKASLSLSTRCRLLGIFFFNVIIFWLLKLAAVDR